MSMALRFTLNQARILLIWKVTKEFAIDNSCLHIWIWMISPTMANACLQIPCLCSCIGVRPNKFHFQIGFQTNDKHICERTNMTKIICKQNSSDKHRCTNTCTPIANIPSMKPLISESKWILWWIFLIRSFRLVSKFYFYGIVSIRHA